MEDKERSQFSVNVAVALSVAILLWKDATPLESFPEVDELVRIELGRVLTHPAVLAECPWLRQRIELLWGDLWKEPWDVDPPSILEKYTQTFKTSDEWRAVGNAVRQSTYVDPAFDIIRRQGKRPRAQAEDIITTADGVATSLNIKDQRDQDQVINGTRERYYGIYAQLYRH